MTCPIQAEHFLTLLVVPTIKKDYGSQKDFTQVWNTTMEGVRWAGGDFGVGRKNEAPLTTLPSSFPAQVLWL